MCSSITRTSRRVITSGGPAQQFVPMTGWVPAIGVSHIKALMQLRDRTSNFEVQVAQQTADVDTDDPNNPVGKGLFQDTDGKSTSELNPLW